MDANGISVGVDSLAADTKIFCRVEANAQARTVDYHCAWDQGKELWMIYLMRVVDAQTDTDARQMGFAEKFADQVLSDRLKWQGSDLRGLADDDDDTQGSVER